MGYPLVSVTAQFIPDGAGGTVCSAVASPTRAGISWRVDKITTLVQPSATSIPPQLRVYRGPQSNTTYLEGSNSADNDTSDTAHDLGSSDFLTFVWSGGTVGAIATATLFGEITDQRMSSAFR